MYTHTATTNPAMAPSAAARASQSRQKGGSGVPKFSPPTPPAVSNTWIETLSDFTYGFSRAGERRGWMLCRDLLRIQLD